MNNSFNDNSSNQRFKYFTSVRLCSLVLHWIPWRKMPRFLQTLLIASRVILPPQFPPQGKKTKLTLVAQKFPTTIQIQTFNKFVTLGKNGRSLYKFKDWNSVKERCIPNPNKPQAFVHTSSYNCGFESLPLGPYQAAAEYDKFSESISWHHSCDLLVSVLQERLWGAHHVRTTETKLIIHLYYHHSLLE